MPENKMAAIEKLDREYEESLKEEQPEAEVSEEPKQEEKAVEAKEQPKDNKQDHAFKQMREENARIKKEKDDLEKRIRKLEQAAKGNGYESVDALATELEEKSLEQQSKTNNVPKDVLRELDMTKRQLQEARESMTQRERDTKLEAISMEINRLSESLDLDEDKTRDLIDQMGADGYTVDTLLMLPIKSLSRVLKGYASDYITEKEVQKKLSDKKKFSEDKVKTTKQAEPDDPYSAESLKKELELWDRQEHPWKYKK